MKVLAQLALLATTATSIYARNLIRGGYDVTSGYDWTVELLDAEGWVVCTGSLISKQYVLTAAHCWSSPEAKYNPQQVLIRHYKTPSTSGNTIKRSVRSYKLHDNYKVDKAGYKVNDIALIKLDAPVEGVTPVTLKGSPSFPEPADARMMVLGWGFTMKSTDTAKDRAQILQGASNFEVVRNGECSRAFDLKIDEYFDPLSQFCIMDRSEQEGMCSGDSGGPAFEYNNGKLVQVGVASFGEEDPNAMGCLKKNIPVVYSDVGHYDQWIKNEQTRM